MLGSTSMWAAAGGLAIASATPAQITAHVSRFPRRAGDRRGRRPPRPRPPGPARPPPGPPRPPARPPGPPRPPPPPGRPPRRRRPAARPPHPVHVLAVPPRDGRSTSRRHARSAPAAARAGESENASRSVTVRRIRTSLLSCVRRAPGRAAARCSPSDQRVSLRVVAVERSPATAAKDTLTDRLARLSAALARDPGVTLMTAVASAPIVAVALPSTRDFRPSAFARALLDEQPDRDLPAGGPGQLERHAARERGARRRAGERDLQRGRLELELCDLGVERRDLRVGCRLLGLQAADLSRLLRASIAFSGSMAATIVALLNEAAPSAPRRRRRTLPAPAAPRTGLELVFAVAGSSLTRCEIHSGQARTSGIHRRHGHRGRQTPSGTARTGSTAPPCPERFVLPGLMFSGSGAPRVRRCGGAVPRSRRR